MNFFCNNWGDLLYSENEDFLLSITDKNGTIIHVNKKFCNVSKYSKNELLGNTHRILKSGHHTKSFYKNLWTTISKGKLFSILIKNKAKDGNMYWVKSTMIPILDDNSNPVQYVCVGHTVNSSKEKNGIRLKHTTDISNALDETSIVAITDSKGIITYVNEKFCEISKYSKDELLGENHRILKSGGHPAEFYSEMWKRISSGKSWHGDIKNKAKDGTFYWVRTTIMPTFDENQNIQNYISIRTDITSQVELAEKLIKAERLSSIGQLASRMAHDLRNPLSVIQMTLENIKMTDKTDGVQQKQFDKVQRAIFRITHQIDDVLDFIKDPYLELSKTKISNIIADALDSLYVPKGTILVLPKIDFELICDTKKLSVSINNLILNAIQTIDGVGTIEITVEEKDDTILIQVKDSGKGIPKENLDKIFEPLFTTKQQGTGLGLASVKSIIDAHGGIISVTSPPTIFTITLPKTIS